MATKTVLQDDLDGSVGPDVANVEFDFQDTEFEIDLSDKNHQALNKALEAYETAVKDMREFVLAAREVKKAKTTGKRDSAPHLDKIRAWAREKGMEVSDKGRIPKDIQAAYDKARAE